MVITGFHAIEEKIRSLKDTKPGSLKLFYSKPGPRVRKILAAAKEAGLTCEQTDDKALDALVAELDQALQDHRGLVMTIQGQKESAQNLLDFDAWLKKLATQKDQPCKVLILDKITDPHNVGAIIRSGDQFGVSLVILPEHNSAREILSKISSRKLENETFHEAYEFISRGEEEKGIASIRRFIQDNPAVWNAWFMLGWGLRRLERFADAKLAFEKARECEGGDENADTLNELAICQIETGDYDGASESLNTAIAMDPDNTKVISNMGYLCLRLGKPEEARKYFMTVLEIDPEDKIAGLELKKLEQEAN